MEEIKKKNAGRKGTSTAVTIHNPDLIYSSRINTGTSNKIMPGVFILHLAL